MFPIKRPTLFLGLVLSLVLASLAQAQELRTLLDEAYQARLTSDYQTNILRLKEAELQPKNDQHPAQWSELLMELSKHYLTEAKYDSAKYYATQAQEFAADKDSPTVLAYAYLTQATYFNYLNAGELAIENAQNALQVLRETNQPALQARANYILYGVYSAWDNLVLCEKYIKQAILYANQAEDYELLANSYNGKSVVMEYQFKESGQQAYQDSIYFYLNQSLQVYKQHPTRVAVRTFAITNTNIANYFFKYRAIDEVRTQDSIVHYAQTAKTTYEAFDHNYDIMSNVNGLLAEVASARGDLPTAEMYLLRSYTRLNQLKQPSYYNLVNVSQGLIDLYTKTGELAKALDFHKKKEEYTQEIFDASQIEQANKLESLYENKRLATVIHEAEQAAINRRIQMGLLAAVCVFLAASLWFLRVSFRNKHKLELERNLRLQQQKKDIEEQNRLQGQIQQEAQARLLSEQKLLTIQMDQMQKESMAGALQIERKNRLLLQLREKLKKLETAENTGFVDRMIREEMRLEERVEQSVKEFENIHPEFFQQLKTQSEDRLTSLELKHCAYIHLKLSTKEIAVAFHSEPKSVRTSKYRIKQKLNLDKDVDLDRYLQDLKSHLSK